MQKILVGVTGGIAAYKVCEVVRLLIQAGHEVRVVMTQHAKQFVHPNTFAALIHHSVYDDLFVDPMVHITLAKWADVIVIAPATASILGKLASGVADDLLTTLCLATQVKCFLAPAMNTVMWHQSVMQRNLATLIADGYGVIPPESGEQACGDVGVGRMAEPATIVHQLMSTKDLDGVKVLITLGATQEKIDPVRYISNFSSGKMGCAMAQACIARSAAVTVVAGFVQCQPLAHCQWLTVQSADEMTALVASHADAMDMIISAAAIADYKPATVSAIKIKKHAANLAIACMRTQDMLASLRHLTHVYKVGFCAETHDALKYAREKIEKKGLQAIIANEVHENGYPLGADTNAVTLLTQQGETVQFEEASKRVVAEQLIEHLMHDYKRFIKHQRKCSHDMSEMSI